MKKPIIVIAGPTACGKTDISIKLAKLSNGEIISADSMQIYKYMDIGTAKIKESEMEGIKHYLIDELNPDEEYSAAVFQKMAKNYLNDIYNKNKLPILVGGTGFYINALIYNNNFDSIECDYQLRKELEQVAIEKGRGHIYNILKKFDPESAEKIHPNNLKRVIRAIEYFKKTGQKISEHNEIEKKKSQYYNSIFIILYMERDKLYKRINLRIDNMIENGLVKEVEFLLNKYNENLVSMQGLGYKEIVQYLKGKISLDDAVEILKKNTRHFAKRQLTWFKHQCSNSIWIDINEYENSSDAAEFIYENYVKNLKID